jgi:hypothetical protein
MPPSNFKNASSKKNRLSGKDLAVAALIVVVIAAGYYLISKPSVITKRAVPVVAKEIPAPTEEAKLPISETNPEVRSVDNTEATGASASVAQKEAVEKERKQKPAASRSTIITAPVDRNEEQKEATNPITENKNEQPEAPLEKAPQKKKKLGEVIKNIFSKNKKEPAKKVDPVVLEEPRPATNRQSTKRSEETTVNKNTPAPPVQSKEEENKEASPLASLADLVDLTSNAPDSWMMGVTGLKITLKNRSNSIIQTAAVNVFYYDDNNRLLEKKMIYFSNVPPKGKLTLPAPDHKFADHVEFKLGAVSAKDDRYVKG